MTTRRTVTILVAAIVAICLGVPAAADMPPVPPPETEDVLARNLLQDDPKRPPTVTLPRGPRQAPPPTTTTTTIRPDKTITDGQRTTVVVPVPSDLRNDIANCRGDPATGRCGSTDSIYSIYGPCRSPYTTAIIRRDPRIVTELDEDGEDTHHVAGRRITIDTNSVLTDNTGIVEIVYSLVGTRTIKTYRGSSAGSGQPHELLSTETGMDCTIDGDRPVRVLVRVAARRGMTRAVAEYAPPQEWLDSRTTVDFECTQDVIDEDYPCTLGARVVIEQAHEFPTPRGCVVIVTGSDNGYGNTDCVTRDQAQAILDIQEEVTFDENGDVVSGTPVNLNDLPRCVEGERPAAGQRCVARN